MYARVNKVVRQVTAILNYLMTASATFNNVVRIVRHAATKLSHDVHHPQLLFNHITITT